MAAVPGTFIDPEQLLRITDLELLARIVTAGLMPGIHTSPKTGASVEFSQYRAYTPGDDLRLLDWKLYGRSDRLYIKQFRDETNLHATILLDMSGSMDYGSGTVSKFAYARMLAAALIMILKAQGDAVGLIAYHRELVLNIPPSNRRRQMHHLFAELAKLKPADRTETPRALQFLGDILRPRGMVILISDLLHPLSETLHHLTSLRARRHDVLIMRISDPHEASFPFEQSLTLIDAEAGAERFVIPEAIRQTYRQNRDAHFQTLADHARGEEIDLLECVTSTPFDRALRHFLNHRGKAPRTKGYTRTKGAAGGTS